MNDQSSQPPVSGGPQGETAPSGDLQAVVIHKGGSREPNKDLQDDGQHPFRQFLKSIFGW